MRTKTPIVGLLASVIAIGGAFANMNTPRTAWVKIKYFGSNNFLCVNTDLQCDEFGALTCKVNVLTIVGTKTVVARRDAACAVTLGQSSNAPIGIFVPLYGSILAAE
jgi:hypothetical protein